jgi:hypothetical protein
VTTDELRRLLAEAPQGEWRVESYDTAGLALIRGAVNALPGLLDVVDAARAIAEDYHDLAIVYDDLSKPLHPAVTHDLCSDPRCLALRAALARLDGAS